MIGHLKGILLSSKPPSLLLDVNGVGYELEVPMSTFYHLPAEGQQVALHTHMVVREDAQLLFGFFDLVQKQLFRDLLKVNGVGPRVALAILSTLNAQQLTQCIQYGDSSALVRVPGVGKKTAERLIIDLRDRLSVDNNLVAGMDDTQAPHSDIDDALNALIALGYKQTDAKRAVDAVNDQKMPREDLIRNALQWLSRK